MTIENMPLEMWKSLPGNKPANRSPENNVKSACYDWLDAHKIPWNRQNSGKVQVFNPHTRKMYWMQLAKKGSGDITCIAKGGRYTEIETKARGKKLQPDQENRKREVEAAGGIYIIAHSCDDLDLLLHL